MGRRFHAARYPRWLPESWLGQIPAWFRRALNRRERRAAAPQYFVHRGHDFHEDCTAACAWWEPAPHRKYKGLLRHWW